MRVLLISPQTDDVELGVGGLVCRLLDEGKHGFGWLVFSRCEDSLAPGMPADTLEREFGASADFLGIADRELIGLPVRFFPARRQDVLETLVRVRNEFYPTLAVAPSGDDLHQDHVTVAQESLRAFKASSTILGYEQPWNNGTFNSRVLVRLTKDHVWRKWQAMEHYRSQQELGREYFSWSLVLAWATMRGAQFGAPYAEAVDMPRAVL